MLVRRGSLLYWLMWPVPFVSILPARIGLDTESWVTITPKKRKVRTH